jgi:hypothetical protein
MRRDCTPAACDGEDTVQPANSDLSGRGNTMLDAKPLVGGSNPSEGAYSIKDESVKSDSSFDS